MTSCYKVFPCPQCQKFTYAKCDQKCRICSVCNSKINIQTVQTYEQARTVTEAHKLAQKNNVGWLAQKGIQIKTEVQSPVESSKKTKLLPENPSRAKLLKDLVESVIKSIRSKHITDLHTVADPYLQIFFKSSQPPADLPFQEFKRAFFNYIQSH